MVDNRELRDKWNRRYSSEEKQPRVAEVLLQNLHLLPATGDALELACGLGGNAMLLAENGLDVSAWDLSEVAVGRLQQQAEQAGLHNLSAQARDIEQLPPPPSSFDLIMVSYFLQRELIPAIIDALRPGGLIFYQTFTQKALTPQGPDCRNLRLADNELLGLFRCLSVRFYREENRLGDISQGQRDVAMLIAERSL